MDLVDAEPLATASAVARLSPVSMTMRMPSARSARIASGVDRLDRVGDREEAARPRRRPRRTSRSCPSARSAAAARRERAGSTPALLEQRRVAEHHGSRPRRARCTPLAGRPTRSSASGDRRAPRARAPATIAAASGCSLPPRARRRARAARSPMPRLGDARRRRAVGLPSVSVPVLSTTSVSTCAEELDRLGVAEQHAHRGAASGWRP